MNDNYICVFANKCDLGEGVNCAGEFGLNYGSAKQFKASVVTVKRCGLADNNEEIKDNHHEFIDYFSFYRNDLGQVIKI